MNYIALTAFFKFHVGRWMDSRTGQDFNATCSLLADLKENLLTPKYQKDIRLKNIFKPQSQALKFSYAKDLR